MTDVSSVAPAPRPSIWCVVLLVLAVASASAQTPGSATDLYTRDDLLFLSHMISHHEQALTLAALVPSRTSREDLIRFAHQIDRAQRVEIDHMKSLLAVAADRGLTVPNHKGHAAESMPGLLPPARMTAIAAATGAQFDRVWLEGMIVHHEGALTMGREQQRRQFESRRQPYGIDVLVDEILVVQRAEITKMKAWLAEWKLGNAYLR